MEDIIRNAANLREEVKVALDRLHFDDLRQGRARLEADMARSDFWSDPREAQLTSRQHASLLRRIEPWEKLVDEIRDILELAKLGDAEIQAELQIQLNSARSTFDSLKSDLKFNAPYDDHSAILSIYAGAGGTDAQDWAQMLMRMYIRWAEGMGIDVVVIEESVGEEAGIKSATMEFSGPLVYGKLKGEHGVHRLVRLSPFNADHLRQTSFAKVEVLPEISQQEGLAIAEKDLRIDVYRSGGHGGQSVNTTDSAVRVTHIPTGITVAIQNERSQLQNKETALTILRSKLIQLQLEQHQEKLDQLKGPNQSAEWGSQIRSYVLHPYKQVKDLRTRYETSDVDSVLDGRLEGFIDAYLDYTLGGDAYVDK